MLAVPFGVGVALTLDETRAAARARRRLLDRARDRVACRSRSARWRWCRRSRSRCACCAAASARCSRRSSTDGTAAWTSESWRRRRLRRRPGAARRVRAAPSGRSGCRPTSCFADWWKRARRRGHRRARSSAGRRSSCSRCSASASSPTATSASARSSSALFVSVLVFAVDRAALRAAPHGPHERPDARQDGARHPRRARRTAARRLLVVGAARGRRQGDRCSASPAR